MKNNIEVSSSEAIDILSDQFNSQQIQSLVDGYTITLKTERYSTNKYCVTIYVNGNFHAKWSDLSNIEPETKFFAVKTKQGLKFRTPFFTSGKSAIKHLLKIDPKLKFVKI